jgi:flavin-dependent dehydrogenase
MHVDVAILGGGLAGTFLARQLRRQLPQLQVAVFEKELERSFKVGESTVEIASNYMCRRLGLHKYLYEHQLPKNGLRFFFDTAERDAPLESLSELGSDHLPLHPSFQLDRAAIERDLLRMNARDGVAVHEGWKVVSVDPAEDGPHRLVVQDPEGSRRDVSARWIVDASGRARVLQRRLGLARTDVSHPIAAVWGRLVDVEEMDEAGTAAWRDRARGTARWLSTNHFCYPGYWIWFIPLKGDVMSVGVVGEPDAIGRSLRTDDGFRAFLDEHRSSRELLPRARLVDRMVYRQLAYGTTRFFDGGARWALVGEAAAFSDPFYSPGSDYIAMENDFVVDLIERDIAGATREERVHRAQLCERFMQHRFETTMLLYRGQYSSFGSYPLLRLKFDFDLATYYLYWYHAYSQDWHLEGTWLEEQIKQGPFVVNAMRNFARLFKAVEERKRADGTYFSENLHQFSCAPIHSAFEAEIGRHMERKQLLRRTAEVFSDVRARALVMLGASNPPEPLPFHEYLLDRPLG